MQKIDPSNTLFNIASDLVNHTSRCVFLTGKAGTGKTTFLKYIRENCPKQMVVVAPTGVAAINAGGVTIHSFFQLPLSPFIPEAKDFLQNNKTTSKHSLLSRLRLNSERRKIFQELELLIIDEISMVRCDILDAMDLVLRHVRHRSSEKFGGVQVLFIGDMFQLPPVVKEQEWNFLKTYYQSPYFFDSMVMKGNPPLCIEFTKIYRQTEEEFIHLLNKVRNNEMNEVDFRALNRRYQPEFFGKCTDGYILLTTHNEKAKEINTGELSKLYGKLFTYNAEVEGDFPSGSFPADEVLKLKVGAQVMFIKNDTDKKRRYFNGKLGMITELGEDKILVQCKSEQAPIEVSREKWENIRYAFDASTRMLKEDVIGSFSQYPLRLAWAITIHKSQGLTFEKAVVDAGKAFVPGQVYVALSRCTNLEGMVLHSPIKINALGADEKVLQFTKNVLQPQVLLQELLREKRIYQEKILLSVFDYKKMLTATMELHQYLLEHTISFNNSEQSWIEALLNKLKTLQTTSEKFHQQLIKLFLITENTEENIELHNRIKTAANWFSNELQVIVENILQSPVITDSALHAKEFTEILRDIFYQLKQRIFLLQGFDGNLNMESFHQRKKNFSIPSFGVNAYAGASEKKTEVVNAALYYQLKKLRDEICAKKNLPIYLVAGSKTLEEMASYLPQTIEELEQINGFGKSKLESYGNMFLTIIKEYATQNNLTSAISAKPKRKQKGVKAPKMDTKAETYKLYSEGKTVAEIAKERKFTVQTIEGHLAYYIQKGLIGIDELISKEKIDLIEATVEDFSGEAIAPIKEALRDEVSFGEIRLVLAWREFKKSSAHVNH